MINCENITENVCDDMEEYFPHPQKIRYINTKCKAYIRTYTY